MFAHYVRILIVFAIGEINILLLLKMRLNQALCDLCPVFSRVYFEFLAGVILIVFCHIVFHFCVLSLGLFWFGCQYQIKCWTGTTRL